MIKIAAGVSAILNAVLLMILSGPLTFFLYVNTALLAASLVYIRHLLALRKDIHSDVDSLIDQLSVFSQYVEGIYQLEMFYGDETIEGLIDESKKLINDFCEFEDKFLDRQYEEQPEETDETDEPTDIDAKEEI